MLPADAGQREPRVDNTIDSAVSDHSLCVAEPMTVDADGIMGARGGTSTFGIGPSLRRIEGRERGVAIGQIVYGFCMKTAKHTGVEGWKGQVKVGSDAGIVTRDLGAGQVGPRTCSHNRTGRKRHLKAGYNVDVVIWNSEVRELTVCLKYVCGMALTATASVGHEGLRLVFID